MRRACAKPESLDDGAVFREHLRRLTAGVLREVMLRPSRSSMPCLNEMEIRPPPRDHPVVEDALKMACMDWRAASASFWATAATTA